MIFKQFNQRFQSISQSLTGRGKMTESNIDEALNEIRKSLLEADVALEVTRSLIEEVKKEALGKKVQSSVTPGKSFIALVQQELVKLFGKVPELELKHKDTAIILMAGLQGVGKTTSSVKLALWLKKKKKRVAVVSADVYRPAAREQLATYARANQIDFIEPKEDTPIEIVKKARIQANNLFYDFLIVDSAGRLHLDDTMMNEIKTIANQFQPKEIFYVVDALSGQDALISSKSFAENLNLTGLILTKLDAGARAGSALSARYITGKPLRFIGVGEKADDFELVDAKRLVSQMLGMGDMTSLLETAKELSDEDQKKQSFIARKINKGQAFSLSDYLTQLEQMQKMGGMSKFAAKIPGMAQMSDEQQKKSEKQLKVHKAIIQSMTFEERNQPEILKHSRKQRIVKGSGTSAQQINQMLSQYQMMKKMFKGGKRGMMNALSQMKRPTF